MRKLLSANFSRLWKDRIFWLCVGAMLIYSVVYMWNGSRQALNALAEYRVSIDHYYFQFAMSIGVFLALFSSLFFGTEYSDGTIRNKIIVGHKRTDIYLSSLITTIAAALFLTLAWMIGAFTAVPALGLWKMPVSRLLVYLLVAVMFTVALSAMFTCVFMLSAGRAHTVVISMLLILGLLLLAGMIYNALGQPETISDVILTADGVDMSEPMPNPNYVSGKMRDIYEFLLDFLPTGQGLKLWLLEMNHPVRMLTSSVVITLVTTAGGIAVFRRKDIK